MKNKKLIIAAAVIVIAGVGFYLWQKKPQGPSFQEASITRGDIAITVESTGTVEPENRLEIKPPVAGRIDQVLVKEGAQVKKGQILAWMSSTERAALLDAARANGEAEYKRWSDLYRATPIISPLAGTLILRNIEDGQTVTNTDAILVLSNRLTVKAQVDETDIAQIKIGREVLITLDAYSKNRIPGKVSQIAYEATTVNNITTYLVDATPSEQPEFMRSGMTASVTFLFEQKKQVLTVPNSALQVRDGKNVVLKRGEDGRPQPVELQAGLTDGKQTEILSGLNEGDIVLIPQMSSNDQGPQNPFMPSRRGKK